MFRTVVMMYFVHFTSGLAFSYNCMFATKILISNHYAPLGTCAEPALLFKFLFILVHIVTRVVWGDGPTAYSLRASRGIEFLNKIRTFLFFLGNFFTFLYFSYLFFVSLLFFDFNKKGKLEITLFIRSPLAGLKVSFSKIHQNFGGKLSKAQ